jgi:hypothetical protein
LLDEFYRIAFRKKVYDSIAGICSSPSCPVLSVGMRDTALLT